MFGPLHKKLRDKRCLNLAFIGGSVTAGHRLPEGAATYAHLFGQLTNTAFPCNGQHSVTVFSQGASASDYWIDFLVGRQEVLLKDVDLVVVDTSVNDIHELLHYAGRGMPDSGTFIRTHTEILMALLLHASSRAMNLSAVTSTAAACTTMTISSASSSPSSSKSSPESFSHSLSMNYSRAWTGAAVLYLGTSTRRTEVWWGQLPRNTDAVHVQLPVAMAHGVPYVSVIDGLGPFASVASQCWLNMSWYTEPVKDMHPNAWGHQVIAAALLHFLTEQHTLLGQLPWVEAQQEGVEDVPLYCPRPPAFTSPVKVEVHLDASPLHIPTVHRGKTLSRIVDCEGWSIKADVAGKPGLLSQQVGTSCTVLAYPEEVRRHPIQVGQLHVMLLKSYEHMGIVRLTVAAVPAAPAGSGDSKCQLGGDGWKVLGRLEVDCLWEERVSEGRVEQVLIQRLDKGEGDVCLAFTFEVVGTDRAENKVKVLGLTVF